MSIVTRYLTGSFLRNLGHALVASLVLFTLLDLLDHIGSFVDNEATVSMIGRYYLYKMGWIVDTVLPIAMLMATLFTIGTMARYLELTALFSSGLSLLRISRPLLVLSVLAAVFSLAWREYVLPEANRRAHHVWEVEIHKQSDRINPTQRVTLTDGHGRMYYAKEFDPNSGLLTGLKIITARQAKVVERIDAARAEWDGERWTLYDGKRRLFEDGHEVITTFDQLVAKDLTIDPKGFYQDRIRPEDMSIRQLRDHIHLVRDSGGDATASLVDIQFNLAFPLVNIIVVFMGTVLASGPRKTTIASGFGLTLLISFGYFVLMNLGRSLGHNGTLHPVAAGWGGNLIYAALCLAMFLRARR